MSLHDHTPSIDDTSTTRFSSGILAAAVLCGAVLVTPATAAVLDFGAALQHQPAGSIVHHVALAGGGFMNVRCKNHGGGPDLCIVFDSADPTGGDVDLGTPNESFGGPGDGDGGEKGSRGENARALGKVLIIAENDEDEDGDGLVDMPDDESGGGIVWLEFSHAGRLKLTLLDGDLDEEEPRLDLFHDGEPIGCVEAKSLGDNSAQTLDLASHGDVDVVRIHLDGSTAIGAIVLDVPQVGVEPMTWSRLKALFE